MADDPTAFVGDVPANYDRYLGPFLFEPYARHLAPLVLGAAPSARILELACGSGRLTRHLLDGLGDDQRLTATDLNPDMISMARRVVPDDARVTWAPADAAALAYSNQSFDVVACQFGLMFLPDRAVGMREWHRVLTRGGRLVVSVWDSFDANPAASVIHATLQELFADDAPQFMRVPHSMHDIDALRQLAIDAGFVDVDVDVVAHIGESPAALDIATGFTMGSPLHASLRSRAPEQIERVRTSIGDALRARFGDAPFRAPLRALVLVAHA